LGFLVEIGFIKQWIILNLGGKKVRLASWLDLATITT
jgi:hypothetical protein